MSSFQAFVDFLFSDRVSESTTDPILEGLLALGEKYEITRLKTCAEDRLMDAVDKKNSIRYLELAEMHRATWLRKEAMRKIVSNLSEIRKTKAWATIHPALKEKILEEIGDHYNVYEKSKSQKRPLYDDYLEYDEDYEYLDDIHPSENRRNRFK